MLVLCHCTFCVNFLCSQYQPSKYVSCLKVSLICRIKSQLLSAAWTFSILSQPTYSATLPATFYVLTAQLASDHLLKVSCSFLLILGITLISRHHLKEALNVTVSQNTLLKRGQNFSYGYTQAFMWVVVFSPNTQIYGTRLFEALVLL